MIPAEDPEITDPRLRVIVHKSEDKLRVCLVPVHGLAMVYADKHRNIYLDSEVEVCQAEPGVLLMSAPWFPSVLPIGTVTLLSATDGPPIPLFLPLLPHVLHVHTGE